MKKVKLFQFMSAVSVFGALAACQMFGITDNPYGPEVNCDADLPTAELLQCVEDKYAFMDKVYMSKNRRIEYEFRKSYEKYKEDKRFNFPDTHQVTYREVSAFDSLKACYHKDDCQVTNWGKINYDSYKNLTLGVKRGNYIGGVKNLNPCKDCRYDTNELQRGTLFSIFDMSTLVYSHFDRAYHSGKKDLVIFEDNQTGVYVGSLEVVRLRGDKKLVGIRLFEYRPIDPVKEGLVEDGSVYTQYSGGGYIYYSKDLLKHFLVVESAFTVWDIREDDIQPMADAFAISLDKRKNPKRIYINTGGKVYEVSIPDDGNRIR